MKKFLNTVWNCFDGITDVLFIAIVSAVGVLAVAYVFVCLAALLKLCIVYLRS